MFCKYCVFPLKEGGSRRDSNGRLLQANVPDRVQTLLMEIPGAPSGSGFGCRATGPQDSLLPLRRAGTAATASEHFAWCLRRRQSFFIVLFGNRSHLSLKWSTLPSVAISRVLLSFSSHIYLSHFCFSSIFLNSLTRKLVPPWPFSKCLMCSHHSFVHLMYFFI